MVVVAVIVAAVDPPHGISQDITGDLSAANGTAVASSQAGGTLLQPDNVRVVGGKKICISERIA